MAWHHFVAYLVTALLLARRTTKSMENCAVQVCPCPVGILFWSTVPGQMVPAGGVFTTSLLRMATTSASCKSQTLLRHGLSQSRPTEAGEHCKKQKRG
jgi:hypothetical protein